jgi:N-acetylglucosaminyldiphosphoundecaprenol N-acetyl-beta-D-mannosaminyltransferase
VENTSQQLQTSRGSAKEGPAPEPEQRVILSARIHAVNYHDAAKRILGWGANRSSRYVCLANVQTVMTAHDCVIFRSVINQGDLVTADGVPLVWTLRLFGVRTAQRVYGPDLTLRLFSVAEAAGLTVGFYGSTPAVLEKLKTFAASHFPSLKVVYAVSPPFRELSEPEDEAIVRDINNAGAHLLFIGLGCPKQEKWMADHRGRILSVMLGVGAAFDFLSGNKRQAPRWMMRAGLEWLFRLLTEPRRLWRRYLKDNPRFLALLALQLLRERRSET